MAEGIPHIFHTMWFDPHDDDMTVLPERYNRYQLYLYTWKHHHPQWEEVFWNGAKIRELWKRPELEAWRSTFERLKHHIEKCDYSRYALLYLYGGVYHDLDFICLKSLEPLIEELEDDFLVVHEPKEHANREYLKDVQTVANGLLGSRPGHPHWLKILNSVKKRYEPERGPVYNTGPIRLTLALHRCKIKPVDSECFFPFINAGIEKAIVKNPERSYALTMWSDGTNWQSASLNQQVDVTTDRNQLVQYLLILSLIIIGVALVGRLLHTRS